MNETGHHRSDPDCSPFANDPGAELVAKWGPMKGPQPAPWFIVVNDAGRYLVGFFDGAPEWSQSVENARRYCANQCDKALTAARAYGTNCAALARS